MEINVFRRFPVDLSQINDKKYIKKWKLMLSEGFLLTFPI